MQYSSPKIGNGEDRLNFVVKFALKTFEVWTIDQRNCNSERNKIGDVLCFHSVPVLRGYA